MSELSGTPFGTLSDGTEVRSWTLERAGVRVRVLSYGGIVQSVQVPDRTGRPGNVVLGFDDPAGYEEHPGPYFGALVGRYANRIAGGAFPLDGRTYQVTRNEGPSCLHGGARGFDKRVWEVVPDGPYALRLSRVSPDGEEGFPGRVEVSAVYALEESGALRLDYEAVTDAPTVLALTNHSYWNLGGVDGGPEPTAGHELRVDASRYTPVDADLIPTGVAEVAGTRFDFREPRKSGSGYDHNYVLDKGVTQAAEEVAELYDPASGRVLTVATTEPGLQLYTADQLTGPYPPGSGIALETQHFPDSPNHPEFPSTVLRPGEVYRSRTVYGFAVRD
ncbi:aldose epimerase family protein [Streptomyces flavalbus]|uniref:Aldose 1-epimerase n=1 Tax=Streptomyces flavalbus TaxID=2665155 RepID=A0ABW2WA90_9ACTN